MPALLRDGSVSSVVLPLATRAADRAALFHIAVARFAERLGLPDLETTLLAPPADLDRDEYAQILAVHMAAVSAVDAHRRGSQAPDNVVAVSDYLLCREYAAWEELHRHRIA